VVDVKVWGEKFWCKKFLILGSLCVTLGRKGVYSLSMRSESQPPYYKNQSLTTMVAKGQ
jgi:hypothetical protein